MNYREIEVESLGQITRHIVIERDDGSFVSFPADPENPHYAQFLEDVANGR